jgi:hypothetical protein
MNESYVVDSAWDNNGVEQLFIDEYYVYCYHKDTGRTVTATAMDMFGNMAQCTASLTVMDTLSPAISCTDTTIYLDSTGIFIIDSTYVLNGIDDNCNLSHTVLSRDTFNTEDVNSHQPVSLVAFDESGNSSMCNVLVTVLDSMATSIDERIMPANTFQFSIIPNPSEGILKLESETPVHDCMLEIYSLSGVLLLKRDLPRGKAELNISDFNKGLYILKVTGNEGQRFIDRVIIR